MASGEMGEPSALPLDGTLVVAVEQAVAAPLASRHLADLGARVVKIERPVTGDFSRAYDATVKGLSSHFVWLNRGKESMQLDLRDAADRGFLEDMLSSADVFIENLAPSTADGLELGPDEVLARHPSIVACSVSGYGLDGPYRDKKAYDLLVQSEAGVLEITGSPEEMAKTAIPVADIAAGMYAFSGILACLFERERTGKGSALSISMLEALSEWMGYPFYFSLYSGKIPPRSGLHHAAIAPYGPFPIGSSGDQIFLAVQNDDEWKHLCEDVLEHPEWVEDERFADNSSRVENRETIARLIKDRFSHSTVEQVEAALDAARIANARLRTPPELAEHPQLKARSRWTDIGSSQGRLTAALPPIHLHGREVRMGDIPKLGSHDHLREDFSAGAVQPHREDASSRDRRGPPSQPSFSLIDHDGRSVTEANFRGRHTLVYFGFTNCEAVCPRTLARIQSAVGGIEGWESRLKVVFVSIDPERDDPVTMREYLQERHPGFVGLTGGASEIERTKEQFRVFSAPPTDPDRRQRGQIQHTALVYLLDSDGRYVEHFNDAVSSDVMRDRIAARLASSGRGRSEETGP